MANERILFMKLVMPEMPEVENEYMMSGFCKPEK